jgi:hypothetical protein
MDLILDLLIVILALSLIGNGALVLLLNKKAKAKPPEYTYDARAILADLATGPALVKIEYLSRDDIFLRSPRDVR